jgi:hypothetical protein
MLAVKAMLEIRRLRSLTLRDSAQCGGELNSSTRAIKTDTNAFHHSNQNCRRGMVKATKDTSCHPSTVLHTSLFVMNDHIVTLVSSDS